MSSRALRKLEARGGVSPLGDAEDSGEDLVEAVKPRTNAFNAFSLVSIIKWFDISSITSLLIAEQWKLL